jgi:hypothetical protein
MTTSFHPQANGRSERTNKKVGQIFRSFTSKRQGKWLKALPAVEFAINSATLRSWIKQREGAWQDARDNLWTSQVKQAIQHNKHNKDSPALVPDLWALRDSADWRGRHQGGVDKLKEQFEGPYQILRVSKHGQDITLQLPEGDKRHPTFHISKIKQYYFPEDGDSLVNKS